MAENKDKSLNAENGKSSAKKTDKKKSNKKNPLKSVKKFFKGVNAERKKVVWPTAKETVKNTIIVLIVVIIAGIAIYGVDSLLSLGMKALKNAKPTTTVSQQDNNYSGGLLQGLGEALNAESESTSDAE